MKFLLTCSLLLATFFIYSQDSLQSYQTAWVQGTPPKIDGQPNDNAWNQVEWGGGNFIQRSPDDGADPSVQTYFKILYDAKNLYVLCKNLDPEPDKIVSRMSRRDGFDGDWIEVNIDSYFDKRTAFSFTASVSGVKGDEYISNNGNNWDSNWDPIWYLRTSINQEGWIAEFRIPLSQLRFANKEEHTWGLQLTRRFFRNEERSNWQYIPQDAPGWVHLFGHLKGIKGIKPQKQLEIQPYIVGKVERYEKEEGNPFADGSDDEINVGLDAKIGLTSDITLDLTVNPDFGQVEADPSQVNLSAFQLFFREQRPFFIEGNNILDFRLVGFKPNNLFYSRRIGRTPQYYVDPDDDHPDGDDGVDEYVERKSNTRILGAAKITGKNSKGFSWGVLESVTAKEQVRVDSLGFRRKETVEPLTNYLVGRVQQDINGGETIIGGMVTATHRNTDEDHLDFLHREAYSAGIDFNHFWKERKYFVSAKFATSHVMGSSESIERTETSSERYFQRPDNEHTELDTTLTSLTGTAGTFTIGKGSGKFIYEFGSTWSTPGFELNDIGFLTQTDLFTQWIWSQYRKLNPFGPFRNMRVDFVQWSEWDFGRVSLAKGVEVSSNMDFKNFWAFGFNVNVNGNNRSNADLRGGPAILYPGDFSYNFWLATDNRKKLQIVINPWKSDGFESFRRGYGLWVQLRYRASDRLNISIAPSISENLNSMQYVTTWEDEVHILGKINQRTYNMPLRVTYMLTPNLSIQYWGQPFASAGSYTEFKEVTDADAVELGNRYLHIKGPLNVEDNQYLLDGSKGDYLMDNPDFNFVQFRSNMVLRWEYIPGSTLFMVWTQNRTDFPDPSKHSFDHLYSGLFDKYPQNIFLLKYTYRFVL